jgi:predicted metalloprotease with PDZ domain
MNQKSLNDVVRFLITNYSAKGLGVPEDGIQRAVASVAGSDFTAFFEKVVRGTGDLDYNSSLRYAGLEVAFYHLESVIYIGIESERSENNQVRIRRVAANSPAERAQLDIGDILIAMDSERVTADNMLNRIHSKRIGVPVNVTFMRGERMLSTQLTPGETKEDSCTFFETPTAKPDQIQIRNSWLGM